MNVDHFYSIGDTHDECQDYASSRIWKNGLAFACIADGCSSSHNRCRSVDVGARLLALSAEHVIRGITKKKGLAGLEGMFFEKHNQKDLGDLIVSWSKDALQNLMTPENAVYALDSTLLFAVADEKDALIFAYGDGIIAVEKEDGTKIIYEIRFSNGAPYYLSYLQDPQRNESYGDMTNAMSLHDLNEEGNLQCRMEVTPSADQLGRFYYWPSIKVENYKSISVMSDGFTSFENEDKTPAETGEMIQKATGIKNKAGVFQQRRMKMMLSRLEKKNIGHYDDLSIASIIKA